MSDFDAAVTDLTKETVQHQIDASLLKCLDKFGFNASLHDINSKLKRLAYSGSLNVKRLFCKVLIKLAENKEFMAKSIFAPTGSPILERFISCLEIDDSVVKDLSSEFQMVITANLAGTV